MKREYELCIRPSWCPLIEEKPQSHPVDNAIDKALEDMSDDSVLKPFLLANNAEVINMCTAEYDEERTMAEMRRDGELNILIRLVKENHLSIEVAAQTAGMSVQEFKRIAGVDS